MAYYDISKQKTSNVSDGYITRYASSGANATDFYELEPGIVLDVVIDSNHEIFQKKEEKIIGNDVWGADILGEKPDYYDKNYSWIGRALIRLVYSNKSIEKEKLIWAYPMESNLSEYPLVNEMVIVGKYFGKYYYSKKLNYSNLVNHNLDFSKERPPNRELNSSVPFQGPQSKTTFEGGTSDTGVAGRYFWVNRNIRALRRHEGDTIIESRFGQSIRFGSYSDNRNEDVGHERNSDYYGLSNNAPGNPNYGENAGGGNPMILIRNRQRKLINVGDNLELNESPNPASIAGTKEEKNVGGYVSEDINHDGSSIHITTGQTISNWVTTCYKKMFGIAEEVPQFSGKSSFQYPTLDGDQIVVNTDRLILSARYGETFHYSKKRYSIVTDSEYTVDAHDQMVFTTHNKTVLNSPAIYLGEYDQTGEPALLGQTTVNWLYELCNWMLEHTHWYIHSHVDAGKESPSQTQKPVQVKQLEALRDRLGLLMSRRVFITGGGFAPGQNGTEINNGSIPVKINTYSGAGVPGEFNGKNYR